MKLVGVFRPSFVSQRTRSLPAFGGAVGDQGADTEAAGGQNAFVGFYAKSCSKTHIQAHVQILSSVNSVSETSPVASLGNCALCDPMYFGIHHHSRIPCSFSTWRKLSRVINTPTVRVSSGGSTPSLIHLYIISHV
jgi:hypothetical protein